MIENVPGLGPEPLEGPGTTSASLNLFCEVYCTPILDMTQILADMELIPAKPGYFPVLLASYFLIASKSGTQTTAATVRAGNNSGKTNFISITPQNPSTVPTTATVNAATPPSMDQNTTNNAFSPNTSPIPGRTILFDVVTPASGTGNFSLTGSLACVIGWAAVNT